MRISKLHPLLKQILLIVLAVAIIVTMVHQRDTMSKQKITIEQQLKKISTKDILIEKQDKLLTEQNALLHKMYTMNEEMKIEMTNKINDLKIKIAKLQKIVNTPYQNFQ